MLLGLKQAKIRFLGPKLCQDMAGEGGGGGGGGGQSSKHISVVPSYTDIQ